MHFVVTGLISALYGARAPEVVEYQQLMKLLLIQKSPAFPNDKEDGA